MSLFFKFTMMLKKYKKNKIASSIKGHQNNTKCTKKSLFKRCQPWSNLQQLFHDTQLCRQGQREVSLTTNISLTLRIRIFLREVFQEPNPGCVNTRDHTVEKTSSASDFKLLCIHLDTTVVNCIFPNAIPILMQRQRITFELHGLQFQEGDAIPQSATFQTSHVRKNTFKKIRIEKLLLNEFFFFFKLLLLHQSMSCLFQRCSLALGSKHLLALLC